jgi:molecular chaperone GrpE
MVKVSMNNQSNKQQTERDSAPDTNAPVEEADVETGVADAEPAVLLAAGEDPAQLEAELDEARAALEEHREKYMRAVAEVENVRRRAENDVASARKYAVESFAAEALLVRDSLELARAVEIGEQDEGAVAKMKEGLDLTLKQLDSTFEKFGIRVVDPAPGDKLDPTQHQAMTVQPSDDVAPNHIVIVIQKGYAIHDRLLRPAMVVVAAPGSGEKSQKPPDDA